MVRKWLDTDYDNRNLLPNLISKKNTNGKKKY